MISSIRLPAPRQCYICCKSYRTHTRCYYSKAKSHRHDCQWHFDSYRGLATVSTSFVFVAGLLFPAMTTMTLTVFCQCCRSYSIIPLVSSPITWDPPPHPEPGTRDPEPGPLGARKTISPHIPMITSTATNRVETTQDACACGSISRPQPRAFARCPSPGDQNSPKALYSMVFGPKSLMSP